MSPIVRPLVDFLWMLTARVGCLTTTLIWEEPHSVPSITPSVPKYGTFLGPSTQCLTDPPLNHNSSPFVEDGKCRILQFWVLRSLLPATEQAYQRTLE